MGSGVGQGQGPSMAALGARVNWNCAVAHLFGVYFAFPCCRACGEQCGFAFSYSSEQWDHALGVCFPSLSRGQFLQEQNKTNSEGKDRTSLGMVQAAALRLPLIHAGQESSQLEK